MNLRAYRFTINPQGLTGSAATSYKNRVHEHLRWIERTKTGKILFNSIKYYGKPVTITPYTAGDCNATGGATSVGGDGIVSYSPDTFSLHGACPATKLAANRGLLWDEILFHELVHVFRAVSGKWNKPKLNRGLHRYTDNEEFIAVIVTNIYISDRSNKIKSGLRASHQGFDSLAADLDESFEFFSVSTQAFGLIEKFCADNPGLTKKIAKDLAKTKFNPLAAYYQDKEKAEKLSQGATYRELIGDIEQLQILIDNLLRSATTR